MNKIQFVINSIQINGTNFILNILCVYFCWEDGNNLQTNFANFAKVSFSLGLCSYKETIEINCSYATFPLFSNE